MFLKLVEMEGIDDFYDFASKHQLNHWNYLVFSHLAKMMIFEEFSSFLQKYVKNIFLKKMKMQKMQKT